MRGNVFFHRLDFYPLWFPAFIPTTTVMASSVVEDIAAPVIGTACSNFALSHAYVPAPF
jgi:hypothetical protein